MLTHHVSRLMAQTLLNAYIENKRRRGIVVDPEPIRFTSLFGDRGWWRCTATLTHPDGQTQRRRMYFHNAGRSRYWRVTR